MGTRSPYYGMTVNERLGVARLFEQWDTAGRARDRAAMVAILKSVDLGDEPSEETVDIVLANPARYSL